MTPDQAMVALAQKAAQVRNAGLPEDLLDSPIKIATQVAAQVRMEASRRGHGIGVRVSQKGAIVRVTVVGPYASRYRGAIADALTQRLPQVSTEVRAMITRRAK